MSAVGYATFADGARWAGLWGLHCGACGVWRPLDVVR